MRALLKNLTQEEGDQSTVNVKRTTLVTVAVIVFVVLLAMVLLAFYASFKAMSAANAVDSAWQTQQERILNIEAKSVQASADAGLVKASQGTIQQGLLDANKRIGVLQQSVEQSTSYRTAKESMEAEQAAVLAKADAEKADAQRQAEQKGVDNFDRLVVSRLHAVWVRPASAVPGSTVEIQVQFAPNGTITNALVQKSGGAKDLDDSVVKAAADLAKIPEMATVNREIYLKYLQQRTLKFDI